MWGFNVTAQTYSYDNRPVVPLMHTDYDKWWFVSDFLVDNLNMTALHLLTGNYDLRSTVILTTRLLMAFSWSSRRAALSIRK